MESRVVQSFGELGFSVAIHPELRFLEPSPSESFYISFIETPHQVNRIRPGVPLLLGFGYSVGKSQSRSAGWPPKSVKQHVYEVCARTSAGRSIADYFAQVLTVAILAKETNGYFYVNGDEGAVSGDLGLARILRELNQATGSEFDSGAHPFEAWPPIAPEVPFVWAEPIVSQPQPTEVAGGAGKKRFRLSLVECLGLSLIHI